MASAAGSRSWLVLAAVGTVLVLWASAFIAIRAVGDTLSPGSLACGRMAVGSVALGIIALRYRRPLPRGKGLVMLVSYGVLWCAGYTVILNAAERHLDAGTAAMLVNIAPILVAVAAGLFMTEGLCVDTHSGRPVDLDDLGGPGHCGADVLDHVGGGADGIRDGRRGAVPARGGDQPASDRRRDDRSR